MNDLKGYSIIRFGLVSEIDYSKGAVRVSISEDGITTRFLPVLTAGAKNDKTFMLPNVNDQVAILLDADMGRGVVLGAMFTTSNAPTGFSSVISGRTYSDGAKDTYNKTSGKRTIHGKTKLEIKTDTETLKAVLSDLANTVKGIADATAILTVNAAGVPTTTPINAAQFTAKSLELTAIVTRINAFLE
jgi:phage baseplate assembly protein V